MDSDAADDPRAVGEAAVEVASTAGVGAAGAALGPAGLVAGGSLALYLRLRDDDPDVSRDDIFGVLLSDDLTPVAWAELEAELGVPPRTIANFQRLVQGGTVEQLLQHRERLDAELGDIDQRIDTVEAAVNEYEADLQQLSELLATLDEAAVDHTDIAAYIARSITEATADIDDFEWTVRQEEHGVLQVASTKQPPPCCGDRDDEVVESVVDDSEMVVLNSLHGQDDGGLPDLTDAGETVVFASFRRGALATIRFGTPGSSGSCSRGLTKGTVQRWCWSAEANSTGRWIRLNATSSPAAWSLSKGAAEEVEFERRSDEQIEHIVEWVLEELDAPESDRERIVRFAILGTRTAGIARVGPLFLGDGILYVKLEC
jgi:hypothetical protein